MNQAEEQQLCRIKSTLEAALAAKIAAVNQSYQEMAKLKQAIEDIDALRGDL